MSVAQLCMSQAAALMLQGFRALCSLTLLKRLWLSRFGLLGRLPGSVGTDLQQALPKLHLLHMQAAGTSSGPGAQASLMLGAGAARPECSALTGTCRPAFDQLGHSTGTEWWLQGASGIFGEGHVPCLQMPSLPVLERACT